MKLDPKLEQFATPRQWELLTAWASHGSKRKAAKALGLSNQSQLDSTRRAVEKKAALRGYIPSNPNFGLEIVLPEGFAMKGQSALVGADGKMMKRWDKTKQAGRDPDEVVKLPDPKKIIKLATLTDAEGNVTQQWVSEKPELAAREAAWELFAKELSAEVRRLEPIKPPKDLGGKHLLAGYPVGDHHLGMLSWAEETGDDYDITIGEDMLTRAMQYLVNANTPAEHALVAFLGDFMHYDSFESVTPTSRNQLDSDTRFPKLVRAAVRTMRITIDMALRNHQKVHVIVEVGNHDLASSIFLAECLKIAYENEPRVMIDTSPMHYHYFRFGKVLIGTHHGHGTKMSNLPLIMAHDRSQDWGETVHRYWWTGHIHQSKVSPATSAEDYAGVQCESFRVLAAPDAWAAQKGYRPHRDMTSIMLHKEFGEVGRTKVKPEMLQEV